MEDHKDLENPFGLVEEFHHQGKLQLLNLSPTKLQRYDLLHCMIVDLFVACKLLDFIFRIKLFADHDG